MQVKMIDVQNNSVMFAPEKTVNIDCTKFLRQRIAYIIESDFEADGRTRWIERIPFRGRVYDFDFTEAEEMWEQARNIWTEREEVKQQIVRDALVVTSYQGMLALSSLGYGNALQALSMSQNIPLEVKIFLDHAKHWHKDDPNLDLFLEALGASSDKDNLFDTALEIIGG